MLKCKICGKRYETLEETLNCAKNCLKKIYEEEETDQKLQELKYKIQILHKEQNEIIHNIEFIDADILERMLDLKDLKKEKKELENKLNKITEKNEQYKKELNNIQIKEKNKKLEKNNIKNNIQFNKLFNIDFDF